MTVKEFINACTNTWEHVSLMEYMGDFNSIGAEPEDYEEIGCYPDMRMIPDEIKTRKVEYFYVDTTKITLWLYA